MSDIRDEFAEWFEREYPADENGSRTKYRDTGVMELMQAAYQAGRAAAEKEIADLREVVIDAADEWSRYVEVDTAPRTCAKHIGMAFDAAIKQKENSHD